MIEHFKIQISYYKNCFSKSCNILYKKQNWLLFLTCIKNKTYTVLTQKKEEKSGIAQNGTPYPV